MSTDRGAELGRTILAKPLPAVYPDLYHELRIHKHRATLIEAGRKLAPDWIASEHLTNHEALISLLDAVGVDAADKSYDDASGVLLGVLEGRGSL